MYDYSKLRGLIRENFGTLQAFANALGIGNSTLTSKLNNKTYFTQKEIQKSRKLLNLKTAAEVDRVFFTYQ